MRCRICGNSIGNVEHLLHETTLGTGEVFPYFECVECGCLQITEAPPDMSQYYPAEYFSFRTFRLDAPALRWRVLKYLGPLRCILGKRQVYRLLPFLAADARSLSVVDLHPDSSILDVGCGSGYLPYRLFCAGFRKSAGIDPFIDEDRTLPGGFKLLKRSLVDMPVDEKWDIIAFHHSLEHEMQQEETLRHAREMLAPDGVCLVRIPSVTSFGWPHYGAYWAYTAPPQHFFMHSLKSMELLARKVGFEIEMVIDDTIDHEFIGSEQYLRGIPTMAENSHFINPEKSIFTPRQIKRFREYAERLNRAGLGGTKAFYLRRAPG